MKIKFKIFLLLILAAFQFSCSKWMELLPPEGLTRENFWKTKEDVQTVVMGAYSAFASLDDLLFKYGELRADLITGDITMSLEDKKVMQGNIFPDNSLTSWSGFYKVINYCNEVIKFAPEVQKVDKTFTAYQRDGFLSEVYFLRGLSYFYLVRIFKDVPLVLEPTLSDATNFYLPKTDGDSVLVQVENDLKRARNWATYDYPTIKEVKGRATKAAIDALLADIALWRFEYNSCITYVENIENTIKYVLMPSGKWFEMFYPGNSLESIFEFQYDNSLNQKNHTSDMTSQYAYNYIPSDGAVQLFAKKYAAELVRGEDASIAKLSESRYMIWKYVGQAPDGKTARSGSDQNSCPWIVYRYADLLLMKAEALSQLGRFSEALDNINKIRFRAAVTPLALADSKTAYEDAILDERALELAFEGKRWFDLLRMGRRNNYSRKTKFIATIVKNIPSTDRRILSIKLTNPLGWYLPINKLEIERNKNLVQNPYYFNVSQ